MSTLSAQSIRRLNLITPFNERTMHPDARMTYGLSSCGYDIRIDQSIRLEPGTFSLASSVERFHLPNFVVGKVHDKSSWARQGLAVQNTVIEPGWTGYLTLELTNHGKTIIFLDEGFPIAQILFDRLDETTEQPYSGRYQYQKRGPQEAING